MFKKEGNIPLKIRKLEALLRRIHPEHNKRPRIMEELNKRLSGYRGEQSLNYHLSFINKDYFIFKDLRLPDSEGRYFQIDLLILTPRFIVIGENKNNKGTLIFDQVSKQMLQEFDGNQTGYSDPLVQGRRQKNQLQSLLTQHKLPLAPMEILAIISNPSTIIKIEPHNHPNSKLIIRSEAIPLLIEGIEKKHRKEYLSPKELQKMSRLLLKLDKPPEVNILQKFQITESEILPGVHCPACFQLSMKRNYGYWNCYFCNHKSKIAHIPTIEDFALLFHKPMSNNDCRHFLQYPSKTVATKILASLGVGQTGSFKNRKYLVSELIQK